MSWLFSRALVAEYSEENSSDGVPSAPLSEMPTRHKFWHNDKMTEPSKLSRYGLMCEVLTENRGEELLMSYLAGFHARISALQEKDADWTERGRGFGEKWRGSSAKYDPDTFSWKIRRFSLLGEEIELLETLPRWGMTVNGELSERTTPVLPTSGTEYGSSQSALAKSMKTSELSESLFDDIEYESERSIPKFFYTPKANDAEKRGNVSADPRNGIVGQVMNYYRTPQAGNAYHGPKSAKVAQECLESGRICINLVDQVAMINRGLWPTPRATPSMTGKIESLRKKPYNHKLEEAIAMYPTPTASDGFKWNNMSAEERVQKNQFVRLSNVVTSLEGLPSGGQMNPAWVEWLMGWPIGHTDLKPLETDRLEEWYRWHGGCWHE